MNQIKNTSLSIVPQFPEIGNAVVFTLDRGYLKQLAVMLQSIIEYSKQNVQYDLVVLEKGFTEQDRILLERMCPSNIRIRFFDISGYINTEFPSIRLYSKAYWSEAMWYKCFIPFLMKHYRRVCYLDVDAVVQYDINEIFHLEEANGPLMAVRDVLSYQIDLPEKANDKRFQHSIGIKHHSRYFNAGMLLFNINAVDKESYRQKLINLTSTDIELRCPEQDVLNSIFNEEITLLPFQYNYQIQLTYNKTFEKKFAELEGNAFDVVRKTPRFIHFFGAIKPWHILDRDVEYFSLFWWYAEKTPFYLELLEENQKNSEQLEFLSSHKKGVRFSYWKAKLFAMLASGMKKNHYQKEQQSLKNQLIKIKNFSLKDLGKQKAQQQLNCYLINLDKSPDRLAFFTEQFRYLQSHLPENKINLIRVQAIDAETLDEETIAAHYDKHHYSFNARFFPNVVPPGGLTKGEIACFLSHRKCWQQIIENGDNYAAVFEDDVVFSSDAVSFLSQVDWIPMDADIVKLEVLTRKLIVDMSPATTLCGKDVARFYSSNMGTAAYIISKKAAEKLLKMTEKFYVPIDHVMFGILFPYFQELICYQTIPAICIQDVVLRGKNSLYKSTINTRRTQFFQRVRKLMGLGTKIKRELTRFMLQVKIRTGLRKKVINTFNRKEAFILKKEKDSLIN